MTRNYITIFILTIALTYPLFEGIVGKKGLLVNFQTEKGLEVLKEEVDQLKDQLTQLENKLSKINQREVILEDARLLGYALANETTYYFIDDIEEVSLEDQPIIEQKVVFFKGFSPLVNLGFSFIVAILVILISLIFRKRKTKEKVRYF
ncbi:MAG: FtsB family cell division protein [Sphaerochaetaceae bacterium]|jgi:cell division protein FtsB